MDLLLRVAVAVAVAIALAGCGAGAPAGAPAPSSPARGAAPASSPSVRASPTCPAVATSTFSWPVQVPQDLPVPPAGTFTSVRATQDGLTLVQFRTATSLRDSVVFLVSALPRAGYTLGRGDAEATEADAPFTKGGTDVRGTYRMISRTPCDTDWLMAVTRKPVGSGAPLLPMRTGQPSPSPLPFG